MNSPEKKSRNGSRSRGSLKSLENVEAIFRRFLRVLEHASQSLRQKKNTN